MFIKDPKTGLPSVTLTTYVVGFAVCVVKLLLSGMVAGEFQFGAFGGTDFAAAVGALGAIYAARKHTDKESE
jgi:hypothetical protein